MVKVAMMTRGTEPDGEFVEVDGYADAVKWIRDEARRRGLRVAEYTRTMFAHKEASHIVDFGDYMAFGLIVYGSQEEADKAFFNLTVPKEAPVPQPAAAAGSVVLGTLPMSVNELELAIHAACDQGRWKWTVRLDGKSLVLEEPFPEGN